MIFYKCIVLSSIRSSANEFEHAGKKVVGFLKLPTTYSAADSDALGRRCLRC